MSDAYSSDERRKNLGLRAVFPVACEALRPFFEQGNRWEGQSHEHLAYRTLKEQFPELSAQDSFIVVSTAKRLFAAGRVPPSA